jgi:hypothetical protein
MIEESLSRMLFFVPSSRPDAWEIWLTSWFSVLSIELFASDCWAVSCFRIYAIPSSSWPLAGSLGPEEFAI